MARTPRARAYRIEDGLGFAIHRSAAALKVAMKAAFRDGGHHVTPEEFVLLSLVQDGLDQQVIAAKTGKDKTNVARLVGRLADRGWVDRRADPEDRRYQRVTLTAEGRRVAAELSRLAVRRLKAATDGIPPDDLAATKRTLQILFERLA